MNGRTDRHEGWNSDSDLHEDCSIRNGTGSEILLLFNTWSNQVDIQITFPNHEAAILTKFYNDRIKTVDFLINIQLLIWFNFSSISLYLPKIPWTNGKNLSKRFFLSRKCGFPLIFQCKSYLPSALITTSWNPKSLPTFNSWPFNRDKNSFSLFV